MYLYSYIEWDLLSLKYYLVLKYICVFSLLVTVKLIVSNVIINRVKFYCLLQYETCVMFAYYTIHFKQNYQSCGICDCKYARL